MHRSTSIRTLTVFHRVVLAAALVWLANGLTSGTAIAAQDPPAEFIQTAVRPETMGSAYPVLTDDRRVGHWVYPGEPITVEVTVANQTKQSLRLDGTWYTKVRLAVRPVPAGFRGGPNTASPVAWTWEFVGRRRGARQPEGDEITLPPGRNDTVRFALAAPAAPPAGIYELRLEWLVPLLSEEQTARTRLERGGGSLLGVGRADTHLDQLNQAFHMAMWAMSRNDAVARREWLLRMLQLNPSSAVAFSQLGTMAAEAGDCREATAHWRRALSLYQTDGDPDLRSVESSSRGDMLHSLQTRIDKCTGVIK